MEFFETVDTRRSIRSYLPDRVAVDEAVVRRLLAAAMTAPSAGNQQPWRFVVITEQQILDQIPTVHPYAKMTIEVGTAILVCGDPRGGKWPQFWPQDCSAATMSLLLAARASGLGSVWCGIYPEEERMDGFRRLCGIPEQVFPFALIPLGVPKTGFQRLDRFNAAFVHDNRWDRD